MLIMPQLGLEKFGSLKSLLLDFFFLNIFFFGFFLLLPVPLVEYMNIHLPLPSQVCFLIHRGLMH